VAHEVNEEQFFLAVSHLLECANGLVKDSSPNHHLAYRAAIIQLCFEVLNRNPTASEQTSVIPESISDATIGWDAMEEKIIEEINRTLDEF